MADRRPDRPGALRELGALAGAGTQFAATVAMSAAGGWWLDGRLGTSPWLLVAGALVGGVAAFYHLYRTLVDADTHRDEDEDPC